MAKIQHEADAPLSQAPQQHDMDRYGFLSNQSTNSPPQTGMASMSLGNQAEPASSTFMTVRLSRLGCILVAMVAAIVLLLSIILIGIQLHYTKGHDQKTDALSLTGEDSVEQETALSGGGEDQNLPHVRQIGGGGQGAAVTPNRDAGRYEMQTTHQGLSTVDISTLECMVAAGSEDLEAGDPFSDNATYFANGRITGFNINVGGSGVTGIRIWYGTEKKKWRGTWTGDSLYQVRLEPDELITGLTMYEGYHYTFVGINGLKFETSHGRTLGPYGSTSRTYTVGVWDELLYTSGRAGWVLNRLEVHARGCNDV